MRCVFSLLDVFVHKQILNNSFLLFLCPPTPPPRTHTPQTHTCAAPATEESGRGCAFGRSRERSPSPSVAAPTPITASASPASPAQPRIQVHHKPPTPTPIPTLKKYPKPAPWQDSAKPMLLKGIYSIKEVCLCAAFAWIVWFSFFFKKRKKIG